MLPHFCLRDLPVSFSLLAVALISGCAVERSSLSIDSNSRVPFLGLQLAPPKKKEPVYQRSISRDAGRNSDTASVELALGENRRDTKWTDWLTPSGSRVSQPLPRTDTNDAASGSADESAVRGDEAIEF